MRLAPEACWSRLADARHATLGTVHERRGLDIVPVVFAVAGDRIVIPIDTVKPKRGGPLQRLDNLARDARCVVLADQYADDWAQLWWVRVHGQGAACRPDPGLVALLADRYPQYRATGAVVSLIVVTADEITGWSADRPGST